MSTPQPPVTQQPAPAWQAAPGTTYTSPIPVVRTHLGHALASEWTKIRSVRSTMWTLGVFVLLVVGIGFLVAVQTSDVDYEDVPYTIPAFFGLVLGQICLITLGVLVVSSEYGTGMIRTTFTASPQRHLRAAAALGADTRGVDPADAGAIVAERVIHFMRALDMPNGLTAIGYAEKDIPALVAGTLPQHRVTKLSPIPAGEAELTRLFGESLRIW